MRRVGFLPLAGLALAVPAAAVTSCSCGTSKCPEPQVEVVISQGVDAVEICGDANECTKADVGEWSPGVSKQSFTLQPPLAAAWSVPPHRRRPTPPIEWWTIRALDAQGNVLIEQVFVPKVDYPRGCQCGSNIKLEVLPTGIRQTGV